MNDVELVFQDDKAKFERCIDFLVRMIEKYSHMIQPATAEEIREKFSVHQCKKAA